MSIHPMWDSYPQLKEDLLKTHQLIEKSVHIRNKEIERTIHDLLHSGGKLLRPAYAILFSRFGAHTKKNHKNVLSAAASLEILHMATLIHDDIVDESPTRRGIETVQAKYGKDIAVYTGDFLFTVYFNLIADIIDSPRSFKINAFAMKRILLGELDQMNLRYNIDITPKQYLRGINGKTAQLFSLSCFEGARYGQASLKVLADSKRIGHYIGVAFQMLDDILDYTTDSTTMKKPVLEDVKQGVYSLPLILAMTDHQDEFRPYLEKKENMTDEDIATTLELIKRYEGVEKARIMAVRYTNKAIKTIEKLPEIPEKEILHQLTSQLLHRPH